MDHVSKGSHIGGENSVSRHDAGLEFMMNTLRLTEGFPVNRFLERTGLPITLVDAPLELAENKGLIERDLHTIRPTALGKRHLNELLTLFLNDD